MAKKELNFDADKLAEAINEAAQAIGGSITKKIGSKYIFNKPYEELVITVEARLINLRANIEDKGYSIGIYEDIDIREATNADKFFIRITGKNKSYVDIDFFEYKKICLDYTKDEYEFILSCLVKLAGITGQEEEEAARYIVEYLSVARNYKNEHTKLYSEIGWSQYDGQPIFQYDIIYSPKSFIKGIYKGWIREELSIEDLYGLGRREWASCLVQVMEKSALASVVIAASISGIFRQMLPYTKETNINMNIVGERAAGKSTICHFALSFFGNPEILEGSFTDADNAIEIIRAERTVIPYILDERMLKIEGASETMKKKNLLMDIFREYEGKVKERMGKQYEGMSGKRTYSPIISSSVESMLNMIFDYTDLGQFRRFMEFTVDSSSPLFENGKEAELTEETAYTHYGYGIQILMDYIFMNKLEDGERIRKTFQSINDMMGRTLEREEVANNIRGLKASSQRFSLILLSYTTLYNALCKEFPEEEITDRTKDISDMLVSNAVEKAKRIKTRIPVRKNIINFINQHKNLFYQGNKAWDGTGEYLGELKETDEEYRVSMRKGSFVWWLMSSPMEYDEKDLKEYMKRFAGGKDRMEKKASDLAGDMPEKDFKKFFSRYGDEVSINDLKRASKARLDEIIVSRKSFDATDKEEPEEGK